jgi:hypothetical protein
MYCFAHPHTWGYKHHRLLVTTQRSGLHKASSLQAFVSPTNGIGGVLSWPKLSKGEEEFNLVSIICKTYSRWLTSKPEPIIDRITVFGLDLTNTFLFRDDFRYPAGQAFEPRLRRINGPAFRMQSVAAQQDAKVIYGSSLLLDLSFGSTTIQLSIGRPRPRKQDLGSTS